MPGGANMVMGSERQVAFKNYINARDNLIQNKQVWNNIKVSRAMNKGTKTCLEPVCIFMNQEPSEENMKDKILKNTANTTKFVKDFDPEELDGERMWYVNQCTQADEFSKENIKNANSDLIPIRNWVVAAERYGMTFEKNQPIEPPEDDEPPEPVKTPQRKVKITPKRPSQEPPIYDEPKEQPTGPRLQAPPRID